MKKNTEQQSLNISTGLSSQEVSRLTEQHGYNELSKDRDSVFLKTLLSIFLEPMVLLLLACSGVYLFLADWQEALILFASVLVIVFISLFQKYKTENALKALKALASPRALVRRDGKDIRIPGREVVPGDYLVLKEGDRISADAELIENLNLMIDESLITGESAPVAKVSASSSESSAQNRKSKVYSGTLVVRGRGLALVFATGKNTDLGKIGLSLGEIKTEASALQVNAAKLARNFGIWAIATCVAVFLIYGFLKEEWMAALLSGLSLAISLVPEELPLIMTIFFAMGAWRMSKKNMLTRQVSAIESLGTVQVLCTDKTGTLTYNRMELSQVWSPSAPSDLELKNPNEELRKLLSVFASASDEQGSDPMEKSVFSLASSFKINSKEGLVFLKEFPLRPGLLVMARAWKRENKNWLAAKGAPEAILEICRDVDKESILKKVKSFAESGKRVLAVAEASVDTAALPESLNEISFHFLGLFAFEDALRAEVPAAISECYNAGIEVVMITGDFPETAKAIAHQAGFKADRDVMSGSDIDQLSDEELGNKVHLCNVFARITPTQKLRIVRAFQSRKLSVAMTGDGVNDGPSLKAATVGIAMGGRGTDVAREAASLVLLDDDFSTIVKSIHLGRTIYDNIKNSVEFVVAVHVPIAGLALFQVLFPIPVLLFPIQIVFLELIIDPACTLVFEAEPASSDIMKRKPREQSAALVDRRSFATSLFQGILIFVGILLVLWFADSVYLTETQMRAVCFVALVAGTLGLIFVKRNRNKNFIESFKTNNPRFLLLLFGSALTLGVAFASPALRKLLKISVVGSLELSVSIAVGVMAGLGATVLQRAWGRSSQ